VLVVVEITSHRGTIIEEEVVVTVAVVVETEEEYGTRPEEPIVGMIDKEVDLDQEAGVVIGMEEDGAVVAVTRELLCQPIIGGRKMVPMTGTMEVVGDMEDEVVEEMIGGGEEEEDPIQLRTGLSLYQGMIDLRKSCLDLAMGPLESISTDTRTFQ